MAKGIRALLDTVMQALPQVGNLGLLFFLLFFIFAALGVELFGRLECTEDLPCEGLGEHAHFKDFGMAFLTLFRVATGDNWNGIMKDTLRENCDQSADCIRNCCVSPVVAPLYFVVFVLMAQFVLVNVVVAVLMKHLEESHKQMDDDLEMDAELERELANERLQIQQEKAMLQKVQQDTVKKLKRTKSSQSKVVTHKPLVKMSSLPPNFIFPFNNGDDRGLRRESLNLQTCLSPNDHRSPDLVQDISFHQAQTPNVNIRQASPDETDSKVSVANLSPVPLRSSAFGSTLNVPNQDPGQETRRRSLDPRVLDLRPGEHTLLPSTMDQRRRSMDPRQPEHQSFNEESNKQLFVQPLSGQAIDSRRTVGPRQELYCLKSEVNNQFLGTNERNVDLRRKSLDPPRNEYRDSKMLSANQFLGPPSGQTMDLRRRSLSPRHELQEARPESVQQFLDPNQVARRGSLDLKNQVQEFQRQALDTKPPIPQSSRRNSPSPQIIEMRSRRPQPVDPTGKRKIPSKQTPEVTSERNPESPKDENPNVTKNRSSEISRNKSPDVSKTQDFGDWACVFASLNGDQVQFLPLPRDSNSSKSPGSSSDGRKLFLGSDKVLLLDVNRRLSDGYVLTSTLNRDPEVVKREAKTPEPCKKPLERTPKVETKRPQVRERVGEKASEQDTTVDENAPLLSNRLRRKLAHVGAESSLSSQNENKSTTDSTSLDC